MDKPKAFTPGIHTYLKTEGKMFACLPDFYCNSIVNLTFAFGIFPETKAAGMQCLLDAHHPPFSAV